MQICRKCSSENPADNRFCGKCGEEISVETEPLAPIPGTDGAYFCAKHVKTMTRLRCGRCEKPICTKCTVYSPAGTRCRECSRNKVAMRPAAVLHEAGRIVGNVSQGAGQRVWYLALWYFILSFFRNFGEW